MEHDALLGPGNPDDGDAGGVPLSTSKKGGSLPGQPQGKGVSTAIGQSSRVGGVGAVAGEASASGSAVPATVSAEEVIVFDDPPKEASAPGTPGSKTTGVGTPGGEKVANETTPTPATIPAGASAAPLEPSGTATAAGKASAAPRKGVEAVPTPASGSLEDDLHQLEALERELGIMGVGGEGGSDSGRKGGEVEVKAAPGGEASKDDAFDVDNLDELEGYLESLAK